MPSDEEILVERMKEWNDSYSWNCPAPMHQPVEPVKTAVLPSIWKIQGSEVPDEPKTETWRDRAPLL
jgi:hypothetical protein